MSRLKQLLSLSLAFSMGLSDLPASALAYSSPSARLTSQAILLQVLMLPAVSNEGARDSHSHGLFGFSTLLLKEKQRHTPPTPSEAALRLLQWATQVPLIKNAIQLEPDTAADLHQIYSQGRYQQLLNKRRKALTKNARIDWEESLKRILGYPIRIVEESRRGLTWIDEKGTVQVKDSLLAFSASTDVALRNHFLAWIFSKDLALVEIQRNPLSPRWWLLRLFGLLQGVPKSHTVDFMASILNVLRGSGSYYRLWVEFDKIRGAPGVPLRIIQDEIVRNTSSSSEDLALVESAYRRSQDYRSTNRTSGVHDFDYVTRVAFNAARIGRPPVAIVAALFGGLAERDRNVLINQMRPNERTGREISALLDGLDSLLSDPFYPRVVENLPDYSVNYFLNRQIILVDAAARELASAMGLTGDGFNTQVRVFRASLLSLETAQELQALAHLTPGDSPALTKAWTAGRMLYAPQSERLRLTGMSNLIRNEASRVADPLAYRRARSEVRQALKGLTHEEAEQFLKTLREKVIESCHRLGVEPVAVLSREKTYASAWDKREEDRQKQIERGEPASASILSQRDLLGLMTIVKDQSDFDNVREIQLGPAAVPAKSVRRKGFETQRLAVFNVPHPSKPHEMLLVELQTQTLAAHEEHLNGHVPAKYRFAHARRKLVDRDAPTVGARLLGVPRANWRLRFDQADPKLTTTGHAVVDLEENLDRLAKAFQHDNYPIYPLDAAGRLLPLEKIELGTFWGIDRMPGNAVVADWVFGAHIGGSPSRYWPVYQVNSHFESQSDKVIFTRGAPLNLGDAIPRGAILTMDRSQPPLNLKYAGESPLRRWAELQKKLTTPRAKLLLDQFKEAEVQTHRFSSLGPTGPRREPGEIAGKALISAHFGEIDKRFADEVLEELRIWLRLASVRELYQALAAGFVSIERLKEWYHVIYIDLSCTLSDGGDQWILAIHADEDQTGLLADIANITYELGWDITPDIDFYSQRNGGDIHIALSVRKNPQLDPEKLVHALRALRRARGEHQAITDGHRRFVRVTLDDRPGSLSGVLTVFNSLKADVLSIRSLRVLHAPQQGPGRLPAQTLEFTLEGPDTEGNVDRNLNAKLQRKRLPVVPGVRTVRVGSMHDLINLVFTVQESEAQKAKGVEAGERFIIVTETSDENQVGVLQDMFDVLERQQWSVHSWSQTAQANGHLKVEIKLLKPTVSSEELLLRMHRLKTSLDAIRRFLGERTTRVQSLRGTAHLIVQKGRALDVLELLERHHINVLEGAMEPDGEDDWLELDVAAPESQLAELDNALAGLEIAPGLPTVPQREIFWDINEATAQASLRIVEAMQERTSPERKARFHGWMSKEPRPGGPSSDGRVDVSFLDQFQRAITLADRWHAGQVRKSDKSPYLVHLLEVAYFLMTYCCVRDPIVILAALLHDSIEDGPQERVKADPRFVASYRRSHPRVLGTDIAVAENALREEIRFAFPSIQIKLLNIIDAETRGKEDRYEEYIENLMAVRNTIRARILLRALKLSDRVMNLKDRRNAVKQAETVTDTLQHFLSFVSWRPGEIDEVYRLSSQRFLATLVEEVVTTPNDLWRSAVIPAFKKNRSNFSDDLATFEKWAKENPDCLPPIDPVVWKRFLKRLASLNGGGLRGSGQYGETLLLLAVLAGGHWLSQTAATTCLLLLALDLPPLTNHHRLNFSLEPSGRSKPLRERGRVQPIRCPLPSFRVAA